MAWNRRRRMAPRIVRPKRRLMWVRREFTLSGVAPAAERIIRGSDWELTAGAGVERGATFLGARVSFTIFGGNISLAGSFNCHLTDENQATSVTEASSFTTDDLLFAGRDWLCYCTAGPSLDGGGAFTSAGQFDIKSKRKLTTAQEIRIVTAGTASCVVSCRVSALLAVS